MAEFVDDLGILGGASAPTPPPARVLSPRPSVSRDTAPGGFVDDMGLFGKPAAPPVETALPTEVGKPVIQNADKTVSTERTITVEADGKHYLIPTIIGGKEVSQAEAVKQWNAGKNTAVGVYDTADQAETAAQARSKWIGVSLETAPMTPIQSRFEALKAEAGPRGSTFAGRLVPQGSQETAEQVLQKTPLHELEAGGLAATGAMDLAAGLALGAGVTQAVAHPLRTAEAVAGAIRAIPGLAEKYPAFVDRIGNLLTERIPKYFRSSRGTPIEFREAGWQRQADIANGIEQGVTLGTQLKQDLTRGERMRAEQLLRPSGPGAREPIKGADGKWIDPDFEMRITPGTPPQIASAARGARNAFLDVQQELKDLGRLSAETVESYRQRIGIYYPRMLAHHEFPIGVDEKAVIPFGQPVRAGSDRLKMRGERIEVDIPDMVNEMKQVERALGPESEFRREFRQAAKPLTQRRQRLESEDITSQSKTTSSTTDSQTSTTMDQVAPDTQIPLSGVGAKLEDMIQGALQTRGMTQGEAQAATGRLKAIAAKMAQAGPEVQVSGGGTTRETTTTTNTIKETIETEKATVKKIIENLGVNNAQRAALHAYYDVITRAGAKAHPVEAGGKTYRINPVMDVESGLERAAALKPLLDAGYKVESRAGNKVKLFRDIPWETEGGQLGRRALGELVDEPGYVTAAGIAQATREAAVVRYFRTIDRNPEFTLQGGKTQMITKGYTQMSDDKIRMGDLAGKWVRNDIAAEINDAIKIKGDAQKIVNAITDLWKIGKVTNPATMGRNIISSGIVADVGAGLSPVRPSGMRSYRDTALGLLPEGTKGRNEVAAGILAEAKKLGLYRGGYNQAELGALADGFIKSKEPNAILRTLEGVKAMAEKTGLPELYGSIDNFYKSALYVHARQELGMTPQMANRYARKFGIDYEDVSPFVRDIRQLPLGTPFVTFMAKATPVLIEAAVKHPVRFFKYPAAVLGTNEIVKAMAGEEEGRSISKMQDVARMRTPRYAVLPGKDAEGRRSFLDLGYILPYGDLLEVIDRFRGGTGTSISFEPGGGPFQAVEEVRFNKSQFTGQEIYNEQDTVKERFAKIADHMLKSALPAFTPPVPGTGFRGGYSTEAFRQLLAPEAGSPEKPAWWQQLPMEAPISKTDFLGRRRSLLSTVASKILGLNVKNVSQQDLDRIGLLDFNTKIEGLSKQLTRVTLRSISEPQREVEMNKIQEKMKTLMEDTRKRFESVGPAATKPAIEDDIGLLSEPGPMMQKKAVK